MGVYINPESESKEQWLHRNAIPLAKPPEQVELESGHLPVCLVHNPMFTAAGVAFDNEELRLFSIPTDHRPKQWYLAPIDALLEVSDLQKEIDGPLLTNEHDQ